jgi:hypothetical protein
VRRPTRVTFVALAAMLLLLPASTATAAPPTITVQFTGTPGLNGWWVTNVTVQFHVSGATSSSGCDVRTLTTDGVHNSLVCTASNNDGGAQSNPIVRIDKTPPVVTSASPSRGPDANGWYRAPVTISFGGADATSGLAGCSQAPYGGPDSGGATVAGHCVDVAGHVGSGAFSLRYDSTAPSVSGGLDRPPDANGWYNRPVKLALSASDNASGVAGCEQPTYAGPDSAETSISGSCSDNAGNAAGQTAALKYDATPPALTKLTAARDNHSVVLSWAGSADVASVTVQRTPVAKNAKTTTIYRGTARNIRDGRLTNGRRYNYVVTVVDPAGNTASGKASAVPHALRAPLEGVRVRRPPLLVWWPARLATYYNVQIYRGKRKVLSIWPRKTQLKLGRSWRFEGRTIRFLPGRYRWYVFPGYGARKANRYGKLHGGSFFFVR